MSKRKCRERKLEHSTFKIKYGMVDINRPQAVFFEIACFVSPTREHEDYKKSIALIKKQINKTIEQLSDENDLFDRRFVFIYDTAIDYYEVGKKSYLFMQGTMRQKQTPPRTFSEIENEVASFVGKIVVNINRILTEEGYSCSKTKSS